MVYADFEYYRDNYLGNAIEEEAFPRLALRASAFLDYYTQGRAEKNADLEALKMACCAIAEHYQLIDSAKTAVKESLSDDYVELNSESVGSWSRSYGSTADIVNAVSQNADIDLASIARRYLSRTGLLYRGGGCRC